MSFSRSVIDDSALVGARVASLRGPTLRRTQFCSVCAPTGEPLESESLGPRMEGSAVGPLKAPGLCPRPRDLSPCSATCSQDDRRSRAMKKTRVILLTLATV